MDREAEADEQNGWVRYTPGTPEEPPAAPVNALDVKRRRKTEL